MRRRDLLFAGGLAFASRFRPRAAEAADQLLQHVAAPQDLATPLSAYDRLITPDQLFFVRSHFGPPALDRKRALTLEGKKTLTLTLKDLRRYPQQSHVAVLQCAGNGRALQVPRVPGVQWVHGAMGQAEWRGVRLADVLEEVGIPDGAQNLRLEGYDLPPAPQVPRYLRSIPLSRAQDQRTLIATHMNGQPLSLQHGAPFRLIVPGWTGNHWIKWLRRMRLQAEEAEGFYQRTAYRVPKEPVAPGTAVKPADTVPVGPLLVKSLIARPADGAQLAPGPQEVVGIAFSAEPIVEVEVSLDGGASWDKARLEGEPGPGRWQVFRRGFEAAPGNLRIVARGTDASGATQPLTALWNPSGYLWNAQHAVDVTVRAS